MATQDVLNTAITQLQALLTPPANAAQIATLQTQIVSLQQQLASANQQLQALQGADAQTAQQVLNLLQQVVPNRVAALAVIKGAFTAAPAKGRAG